MPKLIERPAQEPLPLAYGAVTELGFSRGIVSRDLATLPGIKPDTRITLGKLATSYGQQYGPIYDQDDIDHVLDLTREEFHAADPAVIQSGLYIPRGSHLYTSDSTEQLVKISRPEDKRKDGVVFPTDYFRTVARSPIDLAKHVMNKTRRAQKSNLDPISIEEHVGRSAGHALIGKLTSMAGIDTMLSATRDTLVIPVQREAYRNSVVAWQSHYKAKNIDALRRDFDELHHATIDTAAINLNIDDKQLAKAHLAAMKRRYRTSDRHQQSRYWVDDASLLRGYIQAQRIKIRASRYATQSVLKTYQPFLDRANAT